MLKINASHAANKLSSGAHLRLAGSAAKQQKRAPSGCPSGDAVRSGVNRLLYAILLAEFIDTTGGIYNSLLTGVEWVAHGANVKIQAFARGRARSKFITAATGHGNFGISGMDIGFHGAPLTS
jgi:hypothetical protein